MRDIEHYLENIEAMLLGKKKVLNVEEFSRYSGLSKSAIYKLTAERLLKFSRPNGKTIFFNRKDVEGYLLSNPLEPIGSTSFEKGGYND